MNELGIEVYVKSKCTFNQTIYAFPLVACSSNELGNLYELVYLLACYFCGTAYGETNTLELQVL